ncbi:MAG: AAA family ATPase [Ilumatobacteraceae bacterium]
MTGDGGVTARVLRVTGVVGGRFGRFSGRRIDLTEGLCVVHGPNESGKSTLAELIAWLLAGTDDLDAQRTLRYGSVGEVLDGRLLGDFDGRDLTIERRFNVRTDRRGAVDAGGVVHLGGSATTVADLGQLLGAASAADFERRYRITESDGHHSVRDLLSVHALGVDPERSPNRIVEALAARAGAIVPAAGDRRKTSEAQSARAALDEARVSFRDAEGAAARLDALRRQRAELDAGIVDLRRRREELVGVLGDLRLVERLLETRRHLRTVRSDLEFAAVLDPEQQALLTHRGEVATVVATLRSALRGAAEAEETARRTMAEHDLSADRLRGVSVPDGTEQRVVAIRADLEAARLQQAAADRTLRELDLTRREFADRFADVMADAGLSEADARRLAGASDTELFDGPYVAWDRVEGLAAEAEAELPRLGAVLDAATAEAAARRVEFEATGGGDPMRVAAGVTDRSAGDRRRPIVPVLLAVAIVAAGAVSFVEPIASVVAAVLVALVGMVWWKRTSRPGSATDGDVDAEVRRTAAAAVLDADEQVRSAERDLATATADVERHRASAARYRSELGEFFAGLGLPMVDTFQHARVLRSRHREIVRLVERLTESDRAMEGAKLLADDGATRIAAADEQLAAIADEIGLPGRGAVLDGERVTALRSVCRARDEAVSAVQHVVEVRRRLVELTGSARIADLDPDAIDRELATAIGVEAAEQATRAEIRRLETELDLATADRPGAVAVLAEEGVTAEVLGVRIAVVEADIEAVDADERLGRDQIAELAADIRALEERSDLPSIEYRLTQATEDLTDAVRRGAAVHFAHRLVTEIKDDFEQRSQPELVRRAGDLVAAATDGEWSGLVVDDDRQHFVVVRSDGARFAETQLSAGAMELLRLAVRVAVAESHGSKYGVALPLICDDPTGDIDGVRSPRVWAMLAAVARDRQVIVFTHDDGTVELASSVGATTVPMPA